MACTIICRCCLCTDNAVVIVELWAGEVIATDSQSSFWYDITMVGDWECVATAPDIVDDEGQIPPASFMGTPHFIRLPLRALTPLIPLFFPSYCSPSRFSWQVHSFEGLIYLSRSVSHVMLRIQKRLIQVGSILRHRFVGQGADEVTAKHGWFGSWSPAFVHMLFSLFRLRSNVNQSDPLSPIFRHSLDPSRQFRPYTGWDMIRVADVNLGV